MTTIVEELETYPFVLDREAIIKGMGAFGWRLAKSSEHEEMMALAEELLGSLEQLSVLLGRLVDLNNLGSSQQLHDHA